MSCRPWSRPCGGCPRSTSASSPSRWSPARTAGSPWPSTTPARWGPDRVVKSVAARSLYGAPLIVIDFGTATTFDCVDASGAFIGGAIAPGLATSVDALLSRAARLYRVELVRPPAAIGRNTVTNIQSGVIHGYAGLVDGLVERMRREMEGMPPRGRHGRARRAHRGSHPIDRDRESRPHAGGAAHALRARPAGARRRVGRSLRLHVRLRRAGGCEAIDPDRPDRYTAPNIVGVAIDIPISGDGSGAERAHRRRTADGHVGGAGTEGAGRLWLR